MSYSRSGLFFAGTANTTTSGCTGVLQTHGSLASSTHPSPSLMFTNGSSFYFKHLGSGFHSYYYDSFPDNFRGQLLLYYETALVDVVNINPEELEYVDVKVSTRSGAGSGIYAVTITVSGSDGVVLFGVPVVVENQARTANWATAVTNSLGQVTVYLNAGNYYVSAGRTSGYDTLAAQLLAVAGDASVTYILTATDYDYLVVSTTGLTSPYDRTPW